MATKFPKLIHVTCEKPSREAPFFVVYEDALDIDEPQEVAIYQLVKVGRVSITKKFEDK